MVEDALGRKFPVPSEYDFALLDNIVKYKFLTGPGSAEVRRGDYQILNAKNRDLALSPKSRLRPGSSLIMAVLIGKPSNDQACPMPRCGSIQTEPAVGGGRKW